MKSIAIAAAFVHGFDAVILSNERSADQGNLASPLAKPASEIGIPTPSSGLG